MAAKRPSYQARRNELARAAGWRSYSEQRTATERGYSTPAEYRMVRGGRRALPPSRPVRKLRTGTTVATLGGQRSYSGDPTRSGQNRDLVGVIRRAAARGGRVQLYVNGAAVGGRHGWGAKYLLGLLGEFDYDLSAWLEAFGGDSTEPTNYVPGDDVAVSS